jgi:regulator of protease activity HflC (stomatin/prohibitin superfamily)
MADIILKLGPFRHLRAEATSHVLLYRGTRLERSGRGLSFWFSPYSVSLAEIPIDDREVTVTVHARSADFQDLVIQGSLTYRIAEPALTAERVDFAIDPRRGTHLRQPLEKVASILTQLAQQRARAFVQGVPLREVVGGRQEELRAAIEESLSDSRLLSELGLVLVSVRLASIKPTPEVEKALEAPTRERIQEEADEATFRRRAQAVDKERAIQENEMQNQIELARREQQLIDQRGQNGRREATEKAEAARIEATAQAERTRLETEAQAGGIRAVEGAHMETERERLELLGAMSPAVLAALAARELAGKLQRIDHLNITPELLGPLLATFLEAGTKRLESGQTGAKARP